MNVANRKKKMEHRLYKDWLTSIDIVFDALRIFVSNRGIAENGWVLDYGGTGIPVIERIQQAPRRKTVKNLPDFTREDFNNLGYLALVLSARKKMVLEFWPIYLEIGYRVCVWMDTMEWANGFQELMDEMRQKYGLPPKICPERFCSSLLNPRRSTEIKLTIVNSMAVEKPFLKIAVFDHIKPGRLTSNRDMVHKSPAFDKDNFENLEGTPIIDPHDQKEYEICLENPKISFETPKYYVEIVNKSRYFDLSHTKADCAVLVIPAKCGNPTIAQALEHIRPGKERLTSQLIVIISQMDLTEPSYSEDSFKEIKREVSNQIEEIGCNPKAVPFIPISGSGGSNTKEISTHIPWYKGWHLERDEGEAEGYTFTEALEAIAVVQISGE